MMDLTIILATVVLILVIYAIFTRKEDVFSKQGIPGPLRLPLIGSSYYMFVMGIVDFDLMCRRKYGKIVKHAMFGRPSLMIFDPEILKEVMIKDSHIFIDHFKSQDALPKPFDRGITALEGDEWRRVRHAISPTFTSGKMKKMTGLIFNSVEIMTDKMVNYAKTGKDIDVRKVLRQFTMAVISETMFGMKIDSMTNEDNVFLKKAEKFMSFGGFQFLIFMLKSTPIVKHLLKNASVFDTDSLQYLADVAKLSMNERRGNEDKYHDFLSLMLKAEMSNEDADKTDKSKVRGLTNEEIVAQSVFFMIAGFETTSLAVTYTLFLLAKHPDVQDRVREEIDSKFCTDSNEEMYESVAQLTYLDHCFKEAMRLYPPAVRTDRVAVEDTMIGNIKFPKGGVVIIPIRAIMLDPEYWEDPETFNPDRFADNDGDIGKVPFQFLVFGNGPRNCIGMRFAFLQAKLVLANMLRKVRFVPCEKTPSEPIKFGMVGTSKPLKPIIIRAEEIN